MLSNNNAESLYLKKGGGIYKLYLNHTALLQLYLFLNNIYFSTYDMEFIK